MAFFLGIQIQTPPSGGRWGPDGVFSLLLISLNLGYIIGMQEVRGESNSYYAARMPDTGGMHVIRVQWECGIAEIPHADEHGREDEMPREGKGGGGKCVSVVGENCAFC